MSSSAQSQTSDRALIELMADGDKDALKLLYLRHRERVYRFVLPIGVGLGPSSRQSASLGRS